MRRWISLAVAMAISCYLQTSLAAQRPPALEKIAATNAHEGPVCMASLHRLYYTTQPNLSQKNPRIEIDYLDLNDNSVHTFIKDANMANGMYKDTNSNNLLVAEQGSKTQPGGIVEINAATGKQRILVNSYQNKRFNSPNKVIESKGGVIYFSDPNYGYNQGFKPAPELPNAVYAYATRTRQLTRLSTDFVMPHGLALSPQENYLYVGDTAAIDGRLPYNKYSTHNISVLQLETPIKLGPIKEFAAISPGIPDGFIVMPSGNLIVAAGNGLQYYSEKGKLIKVDPIATGAVNLTQHPNTITEDSDITLCEGYLYVTASHGIYRLKLY